MTHDGQDFLVGLFATVQARFLHDGDMSYRAVWRSAHQLVLDHCDNASLQAAMNADTALARGQLDRYQFWLSVIKAITDMGRRFSVNGERLN